MCIQDETSLFLTSEITIICLINIFEIFFFIQGNEILHYKV